MPQLTLDTGIPCGWHYCDWPAGHEQETYGWHHRGLEVFRLDDKSRRLLGHPEFSYYCRERGCQTFVFEPGQAVCDACKPKVAAQLHRQLAKSYTQARLARPRRIR